MISWDCSRQECSSGTAHKIARHFLWVVSYIVPASRSEQQQYPIGFSVFLLALVTRRIELGYHRRLCQSFTSHWDAVAPTQATWNAYPLEFSQLSILHHPAQTVGALRLSAFCWIGSPAWQNFVGTKSIRCKNQKNERYSATVVGYCGPSIDLVRFCST